MGVRFDTAEIIDRDEFEIIAPMLDRGPQGEPANAPKAIDSDPC
jgi:hypothetical protein